MHKYIQYYSSPLGRILMLSDGENLTGLWFEKQKYQDQDTAMEKDIPLFGKVISYLDSYFAGQQPLCDFPLKLETTAFRQLVYHYLMMIPYGQVTTYDELAKVVASRTGKRKCAQAIGQAVGHNPIGIIIPCHRVIGKNGKLTGYAGGLDKKAALLKLEKADLKNLYIPENKTTL